MDILCDEKFEVLMVVEVFGDRFNVVRFDIFSFRCGNFRKIVEEVCWELDLRGYNYVKIFFSGGLNEESLKELVDVVDVFGVGSVIVSVKLVDFFFDIVEVEGKLIMKCGKFSGRK